MDLSPTSSDLTRMLPRNRVKLYHSKQFRLFEKNRISALDNMNQVERLAASSGFSVFSFVLVTANAIFVGAQTQFYANAAEYHAERGTEFANVEPAALLAAQCIFCALFILELAVRWIAEGLFGFFAGSSFGW